MLIHLRDGFSDYDNWFLSDVFWNTGRCLALWDVNLLIKYAKEDKIVDIDIGNFKNEK